MWVYRIKKFFRFQLSYVSYVCSLLLWVHIQIVVQLYLILYIFMYIFIYTIPVIYKHNQHLNCVEYCFVIFCTTSFIDNDPVCIIRFFRLAFSYIKLRISFLHTLTHIRDDDLLGRRCYVLLSSFLVGQIQIKLLHKIRRR